jgi:hypothetical protein
MHSTPESEFESWWSLTHGIEVPPTEELNDDEFPIEDSFDDVELF